MSRGLLVVRRWVQVVKGGYRFFRRPAERTGYGGPFNGQERRVESFRQIVKSAGCTVVIETGTCRGTTASFMRDETGLPVLTVESDPTAFGFCAARFLLRRGVRVFRDDSRGFLADVKVPEGRSARPFVYLDAHHSTGSPVREELGLVADRWPAAVVMIDDFQVPDDPGYLFDTYRDGSRLCLERIRGSLPEAAAVYFPAAPSHAETGWRRGSAVVAFEAGTHAALDGAPALRRWPRSLRADP